MSAPDRFVDVLRPDGDAREVRVLDGQIFVCKGCCCGNVERGIPEVPIESFKSAWKSRGLRRRVHLTISGCLGPCAVANVVLVVLYGRTVWLHSIDTPEQVIAVYDHVERCLDAGRALPLGDFLTPFTFTRYDFDPVGPQCVYSPSS